MLFTPKTFHQFCPIKWICSRLLRHYMYAPAMKPASYILQQWFSIRVAKISDKVPETFQNFPFFSKALNKKIIAPIMGQNLYHFRRADFNVHDFQSFVIYGIKMKDNDKEYVLLNFNLIKQFLAYQKNVYIIKCPQSYNILLVYMTPGLGMNYVKKNNFSRISLL